MRSKWPLAFVVASLCACGGPRYTDDMEAYRLMRRRDEAKTIAERYPRLSAQAEQSFRAALQAQRDGEDDLRRHYTWMALTLWRTAQSLSERQDSMDGRLAVEGRIALTREAYDEATKRAVAAREVVSREQRLRDVAWRYADLPAEARMRPEAAEKALDGALAALRDAGIMGADDHAPGPLDQARKAFDEGTRSLEMGRPEEAIAKAVEATRLAKLAAGMACPGEANDRLNRAMRRQMAVLIASAQAIPGVAPRINDQGVVLTVRGAVGEDQTTLRPEARPTLARIAELAEWFPNYRVVVEGHTVSSGSPADDLIRTRFVASTVMTALRQLGVPPDRLSGMGKGANAPVAAGESAAERAQNRRVDIVFVPTSVPVPPAQCSPPPDLHPPTYDNQNTEPTLDL
jgi:outer membrane protein OmpA-like peptidoglycan-associated protein